MSEWWRGAVGYEVYVRSFADSDGDGVGDLAGITARLDYLAWLGVDIVWLTPFYPSPGRDHGYDVSEYCDVAPVHGTLDDFDELLDTAHGLGLRVLVDVIPNHTSIEHRWWREHPDYYIWRDPARGGGPPNNWVSVFGGPAWTLDEASGRYWCHLFLPEQPDLDWSNPAVADEFEAILRFWLERGVDGFRVDVAHGVVKDQCFRDNPLARPLDGELDPFRVFQAYDHVHDLDQDAVIDVYRRWNAVVRPYDALLLGEVGVPDPARAARYTGEADALHCFFYLETVWLEWEPKELVDTILSMHDASPDHVAWVITNHDRSRSVSRYGGGEAGLRRSLAVTTLLMALSGIPFLYQGEELGLGDGTVDPRDLQDPISVRNDGATSGRDAARTAMPWDTSHQNGFTTAGGAWLPAATRPPGHTVSCQRVDDAAVLHTYRDLISVRHATPSLWVEPIEWLATDNDLVVAGLRGDVAVLANFGDHEVEVTLPEGPWRELFRSWGEPKPVGWVAPETTVLVRR